jgi:hypothetical protein
MSQSHVSDAEPKVAGASEWTRGRIAALAVGAVLALLGLALLGAGGTGIWADQTQREAGYATTDVHRFSTSGSALATEETHLGAAGFGWLYSPGLLGKIRIRVTPASPGAIFVGIARSADADRYLSGVNHSVISDFFGDDVEPVGGGPAKSLPGTQSFWVASATGAGAQTVVWKAAKGSWTVVVMKADGRPGIQVAADLGAKVPALLWIAVGLLAAGGVFLAGGGLLIAGAIRERRSDAEH